MIEINNKSYNFVFQRFSCEFDSVYLVLFCAFGVNMKEFLVGLSCNHLMELKKKIKKRHSRNAFCELLCVLKK